MCEVCICDSEFFILIVQIERRKLEEEEGKEGIWEEVEERERRKMNGEG